MLLIKQHASRARRDEGEKEGAIVSTCVFEDKHVPLYQDVCWWVLNVQCVKCLLAPRAGFLHWRLTVALIHCVLAPLCLCASWCHMWQGREVGGLFVMWYCSLRCHEICFFMNREEVRRNSCMPDQLALTAIVKFFFPPQLFLYGPLKWADASTLLPSVPSQEYSASFLLLFFLLNFHKGGSVAFREVSLNLLIAN